MSENYALLSGQPKPGSAFFKVIGVGSLLMLVVAVVLGVAITTQVFRINKSGLSTAAHAQWKASCDAFNNPAGSVTVQHPQVIPTLIQNATIWAGVGQTLYGTDLLIGSDGLIAAVGKNLQNPGNANVIQANGAWVTPGLFDLHSHAGVYSFPLDARATQDGNEMTNPTFPAVRAIDAFDPEDAAIPLILASGVTASQILPGSGNVMGGQAVAVKFRGATVGEMAIPNAPVALKFACGENPKNTYGGQNPPATPMSRMGIGYKMRQAFNSAKSLLQQKQEYCESPRAGPFPSDLMWENLVALLRQQAVLNVHCYKVVDFEMAIRVTKEFGVNITAFHHAIESWKIPQILASNNIAVALFSDLRGFKFEAYNDNVFGPRLLNEAGVQVVFKTDHPVLYGWDLILQAQRAAHWGLPNDAAIAAVTTLPARLAGFTTFGAIAVGQDADLVMWDRHPLRLGAQTQYVFIEGNQTFANPAATVRSDQLTYTSPYQSWRMTTLPVDVCSTSSAQTNTLANYAVTNAGIMTGDATAATIVGGTLVVTGGQVACVGTTCAIPVGYPVFNLNNGVITPGFLVVDSPMGSMEVDQESNWQDGPISSGIGVTTLGGVQLQTTHTRNAWSHGILTSISRPQSSQVYAGTSSAFFMGPNVNFLKDPVSNFSYIIDEFASVDVQIGNAAKGGAASISEQINYLKTNLNQLYFAAQSKGSSVVFHANSADYITAIFRVLEETLPAMKGTVNITIAGAAEAHLVIPTLKDWGASVILRRCGPDGYETRRCDYTNALKAYLANGIQVGLTETIDKIRGLRWNAGAILDQGYTPEQALATITSNLARMYGLPTGVGTITVGTTANWVAFNGNPLDTTSIVEVLGVNDKIICQPQQN